MSSAAHAPSLRALAIALPIVFACHVFEEGPHFAEWFNGLVTPGISQRLFLFVNATAFAITLVLGGLVAISREAAVSILTVAWDACQRDLSSCRHNCAWALLPGRYHWHTALSSPVLPFHACCGERVRSYLVHSSSGCTRGRNAHVHSRVHDRLPRKPVLLGSNVMPTSRSTRTGRDKASKSASVGTARRSA